MNAICEVHKRTLRIRTRIHRTIHSLAVLRIGIRIRLVLWIWLRNGIRFQLLIGAKFSLNLPKKFQT